MDADPGVFDRIVARLTAAGVPFQTLEHPPVYTSAEAAAVRGSRLSSGAKALVCKADQDWLLLVLPADLKLDSKGLRQRQGWKSLRFASAEEVERLTGLRPGSIPPFGSLFGLPTWCDPGLADEPTINFNAGDHARSIALTASDYLRVEDPRLVALAEPRGSSPG